ncbi:hypothetical protein [Polaromonas glacialis]|uniref:hypothetical protein n=1 Tax=Polaromonas glacialis TaxID=866564 RepID=UPI0012EC3A69|nr:hypothetical protein [Polaromonas glacialis]
MYKEDAIRSRTGHAAKKFNMVIKITMNLLRQNQPMKRKYAGLHEHCPCNGAWVTFVGNLMRLPWLASTTQKSRAAKHSWHN